MAERKQNVSRRAALKSLGVLGAGSLAARPDVAAGDVPSSASDPAMERLPVLFETDVLVVGGGAAGTCAAVAAARAGAKVAIVERWPILGGLATMAHVCMWHTSDRQREVIFGLTQELVKRLKAYDGIQVLADFPRRHETYLFHPDWLAIVLDDLVRELGIRVLCYTPCVAAVAAGREIRSVVVGTKLGLRQIRARRFIDASGDGDLGFFSGCRTMVGRESDGKTQGMTLVMGFDGLDPSRRKEIEAAHGPLGKRMAELRDQGQLPSFGPHSLGNNFVWRWPHTLIASTAGNPLDAEDLTRATREARAKAPAFLRFFRKEWPGCENLQLAYAAPALGVRESRRVHGLYRFTGADVIERRSFPDAIGHGFWMVDIHDPSGSGHTTWYDRKIHPEPGTTYQIPYRMLVAADVDNLLIAGRCGSATHEGMAGLRVQSHCHVMGQAAGTAAAMSLTAGVRPAEIKVTQLQKRLIDAGVLIDLRRADEAGRTENSSTE
jgi:2-polyprenyl-6-methoxyphenol hydroxylase-like FAD-dependent oxidoreductase